MNAAVKNDRTTSRQAGAGQVSAGLPEGKGGPGLNRESAAVRAAVPQGE